jgi:hypothetical protein
VSRQLRFLLVSWLLADLAGAAVPAGAKTLCGAIDPPTPYPFYVIDKVKTKRGSYGAVSGYLINADSSESAPFAGSYAVYSDFAVNVSASWGTTQGYTGYATWTFNFAAPTEGSSPSGGYLTVVDGFNGAITDGGTVETTWVDCKTVPKFPVLDP